LEPTVTEPASDNRPAQTSKLRRLVRSVRNFAALGFLTLSVGVLALWVRSYSSGDLVGLSGNRLVSLLGSLTLSWPVDPSSDESGWFETGPAEDVQVFYSAFFAPMRNFELRKYPMWTRVTVPHWFVALVFALLAFALKPKPRLKFSLADLLILMTFSTVLIAGVAGLTRLAS